MNTSLTERLNNLKDIWQGESLNARNNRKKVKSTGRFLYAVARFCFLFSLCLVLLYPLLIMLSISLRVPNELYDPTVVWLPKNITFGAFSKAFDMLNFTSVVSVTAIISVVGTACQLIACTLAGYGLARFKVPFKNFLFGVLILSIIVPPQIVSIPSMVYFQSFDLFGIGKLAGILTGHAVTIPLINSLWSYFLPAILGCGIRSGLFIFIFIQFFRGLPSELEDAAYIDGCGSFRTFLQIMLPLSGSAILTVTLFSFVWYWNDSYFSVIYFDNLRTVSTVLQDIRNQLNAANDNSDPLSLVTQTQAAALMSIVPLLAIYVALQKYFTESIERTGIVG